MTTHIHPVTNDSMRSTADSPPIAIFQGYVSTTGAGRSTAVAGDSKLDGVESEATYTICKGLQSLMETIEINQSLSVGFGPLGSVDQKMKFFRKLKMTSESLSIVVHARHVEGKQVQTSVRLASDIVPPVGDSALRDFFLNYGDAYVSSITTGGEYIGVYSFHTETESDQVNLELQLKGQGIFKFGTLEADFQMKLKRAVEASQTQVSFKQMMLGLDSELPSQDDMVEFARKFPGRKLDAPKVLVFETTGYEHVVGVPNGFNTVASNRNILVGAGHGDEGLAGDFARVSELINQIGVIQSIYDFYGGYSDGQLSAVAVEAKADLVTLQKTFSAFGSDPIPVPVKPNLPSLSKGSPQIQYSIGFSDTFGKRGNGNKTPFDLFTGVDAYIQTKTRIVSVQMRSGWFVDKLIVEFESTAVGSRTESYGGDGGGLSNRLVLGDQHFIKKINGRCGSDLDRLGIFLDDGRSLVAGDNGGDEFWFPANSNPLPSGSFILGFRGFYSDIIHQIQIVYATFAPAKWSGASS